MDGGGERGDDGENSGSNVPPEDEVENDFSDSGYSDDEEVHNDDDGNDSDYDDELNLTAAGDILGG